MNLHKKCLKLEEKIRGRKNQQTSFEMIANYLMKQENYYEGKFEKVFELINQFNSFNFPIAAFKEYTKPNKSFLDNIKNYFFVDEISLKKLNELKKMKKDEALDYIEKSVNTELEKYEKISLFFLDTSEKDEEGNTKFKSKSFGSLMFSFDKSEDSKLSGKGRFKTKTYHYLIKKYPINSLLRSIENINFDEKNTVIEHLNDIKNDIENFNNDSSIDKKYKMISKIFKTTVTTDKKYKEGETWESVILFRYLLLLNIVKYKIFIKNNNIELDFPIKMWMKELSYISDSINIQKIYNSKLEGKLIDFKIDDFIEELQIVVGDSNIDNMVLITNKLKFRHNEKIIERWQNNFNEEFIKLKLN